MSLPDAAEARRISAQLATLEQQRAQGSLPHENTPLRLYSVPTGSFVRVLDQHPEPISPGMLQAIDHFIRESKEPAEVKEENTISEEKVEESDEIRQERCEREAKQSTAKETKACESVIIAGIGAATATSTAEMDIDDGNIAKPQPVACGSVELAPPWERKSISVTPDELVARNELVSEFLGQQFEAKSPMTAKKGNGTQLNDLSDEESKSKPCKTLNYPTLFEQWPPQLEERRKMWFVSRNCGRKVSAVRSKHQPVVYWMHNTLRVMQGNFGLEAAILLTRRLNAPLVVVSLIPSSIVYPICHSTTASDAYARFSLMELYQQFLHAGVAFFGLTFSTLGAPNVANDHQPFSLKPNPLCELLDVFEPIVVVADAMFDSPSRNDVMRLARYLKLHRSSCSWSLLSMDSLTCCPVYQVSAKLKCSFEHGAAFASEKEFEAEYASFSQARHGTYVFSPLPRCSDQDRASNRRLAEMLGPVMQRLHLEEVDWHLVKVENSQCSSQMRQFSEGEGLQKLSQLLSDSGGQPAIQAELRGGGVLSLLPFIRHGTLFAGYVLRRISEAIASCPAPTSLQKRKALAMRKVMKSRAANHIGKERDYALYLALWSASRNEIDTSSGLTATTLASLSTSEIIASLDSSSPRTSSL